MRLLVVADGSRGDVQPMSVLAAALAREGHAVTVAAPPGSRAMIEARGLSFVPLAHDAEAMIRKVAEAIVEGPRATMRAAPQFFRESLHSQMQVLPDLVARADFVLVGGVHTSVPTLAERYGVPWRWVLYSLTMLPSLSRPPVVVPLARLPRWLCWFAWHFTRWYSHRALGAALNGHRVRLGLPALTDVAEHIACDDPILAIDPELAPLAPEEAELDVIGHLDPGEGEPLPEALEAFLASGPAPLYIGFGSMPDPLPEATTRLFVETVRRAGCRLVLSRGWAGFGAELPEGCIAIDSVSHNRLFPRCAAIVHHGGSGTTAAALRSGVPQLVVAHLADQFHFGGLVEDLGVAPPFLRRTRLSVKALSARVERMLREPALRERAAEVAQTVRARPPLGNVSRLLVVTPRRLAERAGILRLPSSAPISIAPDDPG